MMKLQLVLTICSLAEAAYISRMATMNRIRVPTAFRPGVTLQRPWHRIVPAASHRIPYVVYRNAPQRYIVKHINPNANRNLLPSPWKTRLPASQVQPLLSQEMEFIRAASAPSVVLTDGGTGAIHTIPAPNLSLAEKPIVVIDTSESSADVNPHTDAPKPSYEVTEKVPEKVPEGSYQMAKVEAPTGFSKATALSPQELQYLIKSATAFHLTPEYNLTVVNVPQQYIPTGFKTIQTEQDLIPTGTDPIILPQPSIIQPNPNFLQAMHSQLQNLQRLSPIELIPFIPDVPTPKPVPNPKPIPQNKLLLLTNEEVKTQQILPGESKTIVQREAQESSIVSLIPQPFTNTTVKVEETTDPKPNVTIETISTEPQPAATTIKYVLESNTERGPMNVTPIYYAQIGQSIGNVIANGFYSAINDVRAAAALVQVEKPQEPTKESIQNSTTTISPNFQMYFVQNTNKVENKNASEFKHLLGSPFTKTADSVNIAYTLVRAEEREPEMNQEGAVYAGQIVEATVSEDTDFNKEKANFIQRRAPIRLVAVSDQNDIIAAASSVLPKVSVVKAKIPPKSKLMFDEKTGEPILRIYASYSDNPTQKQIITSKLSNLKRADESTKEDFYQALDSGAVKAAAITDPLSSQVTQFGLKIKDRSDDYIPLFEEYDE